MATEADTAICETIKVENAKTEGQATDVLKEAKIDDIQNDASKVRLEDKFEEEIILLKEKIVKPVEILHTAVEDLKASAVSEDNETEKSLKDGSHKNDLQLQSNKTEERTAEELFIKEENLAVQEVATTFSNEKPEDNSKSEADETQVKYEESFGKESSESLTSQAPVRDDIIHELKVENDENVLPEVEAQNHIKSPIYASEVITAVSGQDREIAIPLEQSLEEDFHQHMDKQIEDKTVDVKENVPEMKEESTKLEDQATGVSPNEYPKAEKIQASKLHELSERAESNFDPDDVKEGIQSGKETFADEQILRSSNVSCEANEDSNADTTMERQVEVPNISEPLEEIERSCSNPTDTETKEENSSVQVEDSAKPDECLGKENLSLAEETKTDIKDHASKDKIEVKFEEEVTLLKENTEKPVEFLDATVEDIKAPALGQNKEITGSLDDGSNSSDPQYIQSNKTEETTECAGVSEEETPEIQNVSSTVSKEESENNLVPEGDESEAKHVECFEETTESKALKENEPVHELKVENEEDTLLNVEVETRKHVESPQDVSLDQNRTEDIQQHLDDQIEDKTTDVKEKALEEKEQTAVKEDQATNVSPSNVPEEDKIQVSDITESNFDSEHMKEDGIVSRDSKFEGEHLLGSHEVSCQANEDSPNSSNIAREPGETAIHDTEISFLSKDKPNDQPGKDIGSEENSMKDIHGNAETTLERQVGTENESEPSGESAGSCSKQTATERVGDNSSTPVEDLETKDDEKENDSLSLTEAARDDIRCDESEVGLKARIEEEATLFEEKIEKPEVFLQTVGEEIKASPSGQTKEIADSIDDISHSSDPQDTQSNKAGETTECAAVSEEKTPEIQNVLSTVSKEESENNPTPEGDESQAKHEEYFEKVTTESKAPEENEPVHELKVENKEDTLLKVEAETENHEESLQDASEEICIAASSQDQETKVSLDQNRATDVQLHPDDHIEDTRTDVKEKALEQKEQHAEVEDQATIVSPSNIPGEDKIQVSDMTESNIDTEHMKEEGIASSVDKFEGEHMLGLREVSCEASEDSPSPCKVDKEPGEAAIYGTEISFLNKEKPEDQPRKDMTSEENSVKDSHGNAETMLVSQVGTENKSEPSVGSVGSCSIQTATESSIQVEDSEKKDECFENENDNVSLTEAATYDIRCDESEVKLNARIEEEAILLEEKIEKPGEFLHPTVEEINASTSGEGKEITNSLNDESCTFDPRDIQSHKTDERAVDATMSEEETPEVKNISKEDNEDNIMPKVDESQLKHEECFEKESKESKAPVKEEENTFHGKEEAQPQKHENPLHDASGEVSTAASSQDTESTMSLEQDLTAESQQHLDDRTDNITVDVEKEKPLEEEEESTKIENQATSLSPSELHKEENIQADQLCDTAETNFELEHVKEGIASNEQAVEGERVLGSQDVSCETNEVSPKSCKIAEEPSEAAINDSEIPFLNKDKEDDLPQENTVSGEKCVKGSQENAETSKQRQVEVENEFEQSGGSAESCSIQAAAETVVENSSIQVEDSETKDDEYLEKENDNLSLTEVARDDIGDESEVKIEEEFTLSKEKIESPVEVLHAADVDIKASALGQNKETTDPLNDAAHTSHPEETQSCKIDGTTALAASPEEDTYEIQNVSTFPKEDDGGTLEPKVEESQLKHEECFEKESTESKTSVKDEEKEILKIEEAQTQKHEKPLKDDSEEISTVTSSQDREAAMPLEETFTADYQQHLDDQTDNIVMGVVKEKALKEKEESMEIQTQAINVSPIELPKEEKVQADQLCERSDTAQTNFDSEHVKEGIESSEQTLEHEHILGSSEVSSEANEVLPSSCIVAEEPRETATDDIDISLVKIDKIDNPPPQENIVSEEKGSEEISETTTERQMEQPDKSEPAGEILESCTNPAATEETGKNSSVQIENSEKKHDECFEKEDQLPLTEATRDATEDEAPKVENEDVSTTVSEKGCEDDSKNDVDESQMKYEECYEKKSTESSVSRAPEMDEGIHELKVENEVDLLPKADSQMCVDYQLHMDGQIDDKTTETVKEQSREAREECTEEEDQAQNSLANEHSKEDILQTDQLHELSESTESNSMLEHVKKVIESGEETIQGDNFSGPQLGQTKENDTEISLEHDGRFGKENNETETTKADCKDEASTVELDSRFEEDITSSKEQAEKPEEIMHASIENIKETALDQDKEATSLDHVKNTAVTQEILGDRSEERPADILVLQEETQAVQNVSAAVLNKDSEDKSTSKVDASQEKYEECLEKESKELPENKTLIKDDNDNKETIIHAPKIEKEDVLRSDLSETDKSKEIALEQKLTVDHQEILDSQTEEEEIDVEQKETLELQDKAPPVDANDAECIVSRGHVIEDITVKGHLIEVDDSQTKQVEQLSKDSEQQTAIETFTRDVDGNIVESMNAVCKDDDFLNQDRDKQHVTLEKETSAKSLDKDSDKEIEETKEEHVESLPVASQDDSSLIQDKEIANIVPGEEASAMSLDRAVVEEMEETHVESLNVACKDDNSLNQDKDLEEEVTAQKPVESLHVVFQVDSSMIQEEELLKSTNVTHEDDKELSQKNEATIEEAREEKPVETLLGTHMEKAVSQDMGIIEDTKDEEKLLNNLKAAPGHDVALCEDKDIVKEEIDNEQSIQSLNVTSEDNEVLSQGNEAEKQKVEEEHFKPANVANQDMDAEKEAVDEKDDASLHVDRDKISCRDTIVASEEAEREQQVESLSVASKNDNEDISVKGDDVNIVASQPELPGEEINEACQTKVLEDPETIEDRDTDLHITDKEHRTEPNSVDAKVTDHGSIETFHETAEVEGKHSTDTRESVQGGPNIEDIDGQEKAITESPIQEVEEMHHKSEEHADNSIQTTQESSEQIQGFTDYPGEKVVSCEEEKKNIEPDTETAGNIENVQCYVETKEMIKEEGDHKDLQMITDVNILEQEEKHKINPETKDSNAKGVVVKITEDSDCAKKDVCTEVSDVAERSHEFQDVTSTISEAEKNHDHKSAKETSGKQKKECETMEGLDDDSTKTPTTDGQVKVNPEDSAKETSFCRENELETQENPVGGATEKDKEEEEKPISSSQKVVGASDFTNEMPKLEEASQATVNEIIIKSKELTSTETADNFLPGSINKSGLNGEELTLGELKACENEELKNDRGEEVHKVSEAGDIAEGKTNTVPKNGVLESMAQGQICNVSSEAKEAEIKEVSFITQPAETVTEEIDILKQTTHEPTVVTQANVTTEKVDREDQYTKSASTEEEILQGSCQKNEVNQGKNQEMKEEEMCEVISYPSEKKDVEDSEIVLPESKENRARTDCADTGMIKDAGLLSKDLNCSSVAENPNEVTLPEAAASILPQVTVEDFESTEGDTNSTRITQKGDNDDIKNKSLLLSEPYLGKAAEKWDTGNKTCTSDDVEFRDENLVMLSAENNEEKAGEADMQGRLTEDDNVKACIEPEKIDFPTDKQVDMPLDLAENISLNSTVCDKNIPGPESKILIENSTLSEAGKLKPSKQEVQEEENCRNEARTSEEITDVSEKTESTEVHHSSFSDLLHVVPATKIIPTADTCATEKEPAINKDNLHAEKPHPVEHEGAKTDEEKDSGEESGEHQMSDCGSEAPVMVEAGDADVKVVHKKSHNLLSGVGSKVKHSIAKVKKAITGKSPHPKPPSPKKATQ